jgi:hypothetical protein
MISVLENDVTQEEAPAVFLQALECEVNDLLRVIEGRRSGITGTEDATTNPCSIERIAVVPLEIHLLEPADAASGDVRSGRDDVHERVVVGQSEPIIGAVVDPKAGDVD